MACCRRFSEVEVRGKGNPYSQLRYPGGGADQCQKRSFLIVSTVLYLRCSSIILYDSGQSCTPNR